MKISRKKMMEALMVVLVIAITSMIFMNSFKDLAVSHHSSDVITDVIAPNPTEDNKALELFVRKMAHVFEFAVLGAAVMLLLYCVQKTPGKTFYGLALFYTLAVAVLDEHIQTFSDRTSSTGDIILDFSGTLAGFFVGWLIIRIYTAIRRRFGRVRQEKDQ